MRRASLLVCVLLLAPAVVAGCGPISYLAYLVAPPERQVRRQAEHTGLVNQTVAVVVYADVAQVYGYDSCLFELTTAVNHELTQNVSGVKVIDPRRVLRYQRENLYWDSMPLPEVARALEADYVLYISLSEFSMREPDSEHLARGRISAQTSLWRARPDAGSDGCVWRKEALAVVHPEETPAGLANPREDQVLRLQTVGIFADRLAKHFYDHKVPQSQLEKM